MVSTIAVICIALLAYGYWLQFVRHLEPCPLCIFQRIAFMGLAVIALIAAMHNPPSTTRLPLDVVYTRSLAAVVR